jgi:hypothetical protein
MLWDFTDTQITVQVPAGATGPVGVTVRRVAGPGSNSYPFTYLGDSPPPPVTYAETVGLSGSGTFTNYTNAGGTLGTRIAAYQTVQITCRLTGFVVADGNPWWYRVASPPWDNVFYTPADNFYNNDATSVSLLGTPWVDERVPVC